MFARSVSSRVRWLAVAALAVFLWSLTQDFQYSGVDWIAVFGGTATSSCQVRYLSLVDSDWVVGSVLVAGAMIACAALVDRRHTHVGLAAATISLAALAYLGGLWLAREASATTGSYKGCLLDLEPGFFEAGASVGLAIAATVEAFIERIDADRVARQLALGLGLSEDSSDGEFIEHKA